MSRGITPSRLAVMGAEDYQSGEETPSFVSHRISTSKGKSSIFKVFSSHRPSEYKATYEKLRENGYTKEELKDYHQVFSLFDTDGSGSIGADELGSAMRSMGMNPGDAELDNLIRNFYSTLAWDHYGEVDADGNGEIDFEEFCGVMKKMTKKKVTWDDIVKQCFAVFDRNGSGTVTEVEFEYVLGTLGELQGHALIEQIFSEFDVDGNGLGPIL